MSRFWSACGAPFRVIGSAIMWAVCFSGDQIRALMCWAMLAGIAVLGFTNIGMTYAASNAVAAGEKAQPFLDILIEQIRYNSILQGLMIGGVVMIAVQAGSLKAKIGELVNVEATLRQAAVAAGQPQEDPQP